MKPCRIDMRKHFVRRLLLSTLNHQLSTFRRFRSAHGQLPGGRADWSASLKPRESSKRYRRRVAETIITLKDFTTECVVITARRSLLFSLLRRARQFGNGAAPANPMRPLPPNWPQRQ